jgi:NADPH-dependent 2,4-dienoyl-CoA reductase/sulfur reductase-like enzyme
MTVPIAEELKAHGVELAVGETVTGFAEYLGHIRVSTQAGRYWDTDLVVLAVGVVPDSGLAKACGLVLGPRGHITVDQNLRTSDPSIFAIGDAIEVHHTVTGQRTAVPLAGPASRQGRVVADVISGKGRAFRGVQGTAVCGIFNLTAASTGVNEKSLKNSGIPYDAVYALPYHHVSYYPGAKPFYL